MGEIKSKIADRATSTTLYGGLALVGVFINNDQYLFALLAYVAYCVKEAGVGVAKYLSKARVDSSKEYAKISGNDEANN